MSQLWSLTILSILFQVSFSLRWVIGSGGLPEPLSGISHGLDFRDFHTWVDLVAHALPPLATTACLEAAFGLWRAEERQSQERRTREIRVEERERKANERTARQIRSGKLPSYEDVIDAHATHGTWEKAAKSLRISVSTIYRIRSQGVSDEEEKEQKIVSLP